MNAASLALQCETFGEQIECRLDRAVQRVTSGPRHESRHRGDLDDPSFSTQFHSRKKSMGQFADGSEKNPDEFLVLLPRLRQIGARETVSGVVDEYLDLDPVSFQIRNQICHCHWIRKIPPLDAAVDGVLLGQF